MMMPDFRRHPKVRVLGVPLGLGTGRCCPQGSGPWGVRTDILKAALERIGCEVQDTGSLPVPVPESEGNPKARFLKEIAVTCGLVARWMEECHAVGAMPLVLGGDHSIASGTVAGSSSWFRSQGGAIGLLWLDAHADMNTPETTPSGNVHGMSLASLLGLGPPELASLEGFQPKVDPSHTVLVGVRDVDREECANIERARIRIITMREIDERGMFDVMQEAMEIVQRAPRGFHLSFDMDALDPSVAPGVGTPVPGGLTYREAHLAMEMLADTGRLVSMDMVEVNPVLDQDGLTARVSIGLIGSALGKSILPSHLAPRHAPP